MDENSHSISDHTQSILNGIIGEIFLQTKEKIYFENVEVFPDVASKTVEIKANVFSTEKQETTKKIHVFAQLKNSKRRDQGEVIPGR